MSGRGSDVLSASALATGRVLWRKSLGGAGLDTLYAAGHGVVLYGAAGNTDALVAVSAATGAQLWSTPDASFTGGGGEVILDGSKVIDGVQNIQALSAANGHQLWQATDGAGAGGPDAFAVSGGLVIRTATIAGKPYLEGRGEATGKLQWKTPAPCTSVQNNINIAIGGTVIYVDDTCSGTLRAYRLHTGALRWQVRDAGVQEDAGLATAAAVVYAVGESGTQAAVWAYSAGQSRWRALLGSGTFVASTPTLANGVVYVAVQRVTSKPSTTETTVAINAATGARLWTSPVLTGTGDTPFVAVGHLLVGAAVFGLR
jgi:outer membrane protein assembly factor BamB